MDDHSQLIYPHLLASMYEQHHQPHWAPVPYLVGAADMPGKPPLSAAGGQPLPLSLMNQHQQQLILPDTTSGSQSQQQNKTTHQLAPNNQPSSIFCSQPVKGEMMYGDYNITPLGAPAGPSAAAAGPDPQQQLYGTPMGGGGPPLDCPQQLSALSFFGGAGHAYPGVAVSGVGPSVGGLGGGLMGNPMGPLLGGLTNAVGDAESEQLKRDKELIYSHPLFPLLSVLFQKCELATCTPREPIREGDQVDTAHVCSAASFDEDLAEFAKTVQMNKPIYVPNPELDSLMLNAIQVLRYHLLELEKVHELCDNFCNKYVTKIKERTQMDIIAGEQPQQATAQQHRQSVPPPSSQQMSQLQSPASSQQMEQQQHFGGHPQYGDQQQQQLGLQQHLESLQHQPQQPCSSGPQQMGYLELGGAGQPPSAALLNNGDQHHHHLNQQHQFYEDAKMHGGHHFETTDNRPQQMVLSEQKPTKKLLEKGRQNGGGQQLAGTEDSGNGNNIGGGGNNPSPDTTARTDSAGALSRSSTAAAMVEEQQQHQQQLLQNGLLAEGMDETGEDGDFSNCGDSMLGEERDSAGSESEQKPLNGGGGQQTNGGSQTGGGGSNKKKVPKVFSKEAISKFRAWLFNNITHPYPSEEQKRQLAAETGLTMLQVNNWFINARRRIVQPMIDSNNRAGKPVSVMRSRRRKSSGAGTPPSPCCGPPDHRQQSPSELIANGGGGSAPPLAAANSASPTAAHPSNPNPASVPPPPPAPVQLTLPFSTASPVLPTQQMVSQYQANAAAAAAVAAAVNPYAAAGFGAAFPFAGMGAAMMPSYGGLNGGGWGGIDLSQTQPGGLDG